MRSFSDLPISQANCLLECKLGYARSQLKEDNEVPCTPWYLPTKDEEIMMCDPWAAVKFNKKLDEIPKDTCVHCLPDCQDTIYDTTITALPFRRYLNLELIRLLIN